mmetsp:Transcript_45376/g.125808  ORF Transcript_45376/g.125808 Transcript_45376/m.125808 type:complete len:414 (-) Transcript_45376:176-1417(-)
MSERLKEILLAALDTHHVQEGGKLVLIEEGQTHVTVLFVYCQSTEEIILEDVLGGALLPERLRHLHDDKGQPLSDNAFLIGHQALEVREDLLLSEGFAKLLRHLRRALGDRVLHLRFRILHQHLADFLSHLAGRFRRLDDLRKHLGDRDAHAPRLVRGRFQELSSQRRIEGPILEDNGRGLDGGHLHVIVVVVEEVGVQLGEITAVLLVLQVLVQIVRVGASFICEIGHGIKEVSELRRSLRADKRVRIRARMIVRTEIFERLHYLLASRGGLRTGIRRVGLGDEPARRDAWRPIIARLAQKVENRHQICLKLIGAELSGDVVDRRNGRFANLRLAILAQYFERVEEQLIIFAACIGEEIDKFAEHSGNLGGDLIREIVGRIDNRISNVNEDALHQLFFLIRFVLRERQTNLL